MGQSEFICRAVLSGGIVAFCLLSGVMVIGIGSVHLKYIFDKWKSRRERVALVTCLKWEQKNYFLHDLGLWFVSPGLKNLWYTSLPSYTISGI